jgi:ubiquinone/menaquinone biosynthesis C-methylase UbiE
MNDSHNKRDDWSNYWRGRAAKQSGEVFSGVGIEKSSELTRFWRDIYSAPQVGPIVDVACGAGSSIRHAYEAGWRDLLGIDISGAALTQCKESVPTLKGVIASADNLPLSDQSVGHIVSQFGFEYADRKRAAREFSRILFPSGTFVAIVHLKTGAIAAECERHLARLEAIKTSNYIQCVRTLFTAVKEFEQNPSSSLHTKTNEARKNFVQAQTNLLPEINLGGLAGYLHKGASQLYERRSYYLATDMTGWIDQMSNEILAYAGRMSSMLGAAIDEAEASRLLTTIAPHRTHSIEAFYIGGAPAALALKAI